jgi:acylphosphatase
MPAIRVVVRGRVQGVGFRAFALRRALTMGIWGEVVNDRDGSVQAIAEHDSPEVLAAFVEALREGPGRVDSVTTEVVPTHEYRDFTIGYFLD